MEQDQIRKAAQDLLDALAIALPKVESAIVMETNRGRPYDGPNIRPQMDALEAALGAAPEPVIPKEEHAYISTACYHGLHDRCRQSCKFCSTPCRCDCGHKAGNVEAPERRDADVVPKYYVGDELASVGPIRDEYIVKLTDMTAALTQRAELAESRVKELSKPVTDEEWASTAKWPKGVWRDHLDALIAARSPGMSYEEIQVAYDKRIADSARAASGASDSAPVGGKE